MNCSDGRSRTLIARNRRLHSQNRDHVANLRRKVGLDGIANWGEVMYETMDEFLLFYKKMIFTGWDTFGPQEYVTTLISVGLVGWYLMRRGASM